MHSKYPLLQSQCTFETQLSKTKAEFERMNKDTLKTCVFMPVCMCVCIYKIH